MGVAARRSARLNYEEAVVFLLDGQSRCSRSPRCLDPRPTLPAKGRDPMLGTSSSLLSSGFLSVGVSPIVHVIAGGGSPCPALAQVGNAALYQQESLKSNSSFEDLGSVCFIRAVAIVNVNVRGVEEIDVANM